MESKELAEFVDQQRWLLNSGLINDGIKNQLFMYGSIVHKDVQAVELDIKPEERHISYTVYVPTKLLKKIEEYKRLSTSTSLFGMWRFKRMLQKGDNLNFQQILGKFVSDFCGPAWSTEVKVVNIAAYEEGFQAGGADSPPADKQVN